MRRKSNGPTISGSDTVNTNIIGLQNINNAIHVIYNQIGMTVNSAVAIIFM